MVAAAVQAVQDFESEGGQDRRAALFERIRAITGRLEKEACDRVGKRELVEKRWLADLAQYHGKYDDKILADLTAAKKSTIFINETRPKTNACEARLFDMLFPTDERNYSIQPTPVPELTAAAEEAAIAAAQAQKQAAENPEDPQAQMNAQRTESIAADLKARMDEARKRAQAMEDEIDDHLRECRYAAQAREIIRDACKIGTGIMKGPVIGGRTRRAWRKGEDGTYVMEQVEDARPKYWRVDPWSFFPDMDATSMEDCESVFERHLMNAKELRKLAREPGFNADAVRRLLRDQPRSSTPTYISDLRSITGAYHDSAIDRYHVWEYHGPLCAEDIQDIAEAIGKPELIGELGLDDEPDPLMELNVIIWFCQGELLKFGIHPLDSDDPLYSVFCLERDDASIFGFGVPYLMRDEQKTMCAAWRIMLDNAGLSSGPQMVVNDQVIEPANGMWTLEPHKIWKRKSDAPTNQPAFEMYHIDPRQGEMANIISLARQFMDETTGISQLAQGEQGSHVTRTAQGMALLMNATNVVFRRIVRNFDDDLTTPCIRRMYDFLMQFSEKEHIKGDYEVDARGSSTLLMREMQSANLMVFLTQFAGHPIVGRFLKNEGLPALRRLVQTMMIPADELVKTDEEVAQDEALAAQQPPPPNPDVLKVEAQMNIAEMDRMTRLELAQMERDTAMMRYAAQMNLDLEKLAAMLDDRQKDRETKERMFAAEAAMEQRFAAQGIASGSGGYLSAGGAA